MRRVGVIAAIVAVITVYALRLDRAAGLYVDDAWYIVLAEALWKGEGFRLISSAASPIVATFPPGFPLILAPVVGALPEFPANVPALKAVSMVAMLGVGVSIFIFLIRYQHASRTVAATVAVITVSIPAFVFLTTSTVMAEPVFTALHLCLVVAVERSARDRSGRTSGVAISGVIAGATLLVRMAGVAATLAAACYLVKRRGMRSALIFSVIATTCYLPWGVYGYLNQPTPHERAAHGGSVTYPYRELLAMRYGGEERSGRITAAGLMRRVSDNLLNVFGRDVGAMVIPALYRPPIESGYEVFGMTGETGIRASSMGRATGVVVVSLAVSIVVIAGWLVTTRRSVTVAEWMVAATLAMVVLVPAPTFRYVLPLAPFVVFYFFAGLETLFGTTKRPDHSPIPAVRIAAACVLVMFAAEHATYIWRAWRGPAPLWTVEYQDARLVTDWLATTGPGFVVSNNPGLVYLATRRRGLSMGDADANWRRWREMGVRHGAAIQQAPKPDPSLGYRVVYETPRQKLWVLELPAASDGK
jgi:hypothetical protein